MARRYFNTIELEDAGSFGKMTILLGSGVIEFVAESAGEFGEFVKFERLWSGQANQGDTMKLETPEVITEFNVRHISCIDLYWPKK